MNKLLSTDSNFNTSHSKFSHLNQINYALWYSVLTQWKQFSLRVNRFSRLKRLKKFPIIKLPIMPGIAVVSIHVTL